MYMRKVLVSAAVGIALAVGFAAAPACVAAETHATSIAPPAAAAAPQVWSLGTIQFVNLEKGYGFISYAGRALFFSASTAWGNWWSYHAGESVEFQVSGDSAISVHPFP